MATFHSMRKNAIREQAPIVSMLMTIAESQGKYDPPPEMGINKKMIPTDDASVPRKSILRTLS